MRRWVLGLGVLLALGLCPAARATPIPEGGMGSPPAFVGGPWTPQPVRAAAAPRHPFMAPNDRSNLHDDAYQTDTAAASARSAAARRGPRRSSPPTAPR